MRSSGKILGTVLGLCVYSGAAFAQDGAPATPPLRESLAELLKTHQTIVAAQEDLLSSREEAKAAIAPWYPNLDFDAHYGYQHQTKFEAANTSAVTREAGVTLTQMLADFGATNAAIDAAALSYDQSAVQLEIARQDLILEAVTAYLECLRQTKIQKLALKSVDNIKRQAKLEDAMVEEGAGLSTDVLQAKTQLAGAEARRARADGTLVTALNRYRAVFGKPPETIETMVEPAPPTERLPETLDEAIAIARKNNPEVRSADLSVRIKLLDITQTKAEQFYPTFNVVAESNYKKDVDGTLGFKSDNSIKLEVSYSLDLGLTAVNTLRASEHSHKATRNRLIDTTIKTEEEVRNAWQTLLTTKENAAYLQNQANIAGEFLTLAREERRMGDRSLIDVLAGETALINASSDAVSAKTDVAIAAFTLLRKMGRLKLDVIE